MAIIANDGFYQCFQHVLRAYHLHRSGRAFLLVSELGATLRKLTITGLVVLALLRPVAAGADTLTLDAPRFGKGLAVWVTTSGLVNKTERVWAGEINWLWSSSSGVSELYAYCVDFFSNALNPQTVTVKTTDELTPETDPFTTVGAGGRAAWLVNSYADTIRSSGNNYEAAGLQMAIWKTLYVSTPSTISFSFSGFSLPTPSDGHDANYWADNYLGNLGGNSSTATYYDAVGQNTGQDQIAPLPEPASILLLGLGVGPLVGYRYRSRQRRDACS